MLLKYKKNLRKDIKTVRDRLSEVVKIRSISDCSNNSGDIYELCGDNIRPEIYCDNLALRFKNLKRNSTDICNNIDKVLFASETTVDEVVNCLRTYGVAIFPALYKDSFLKNIQEEFNNLMLSGNQYADQVDSRENTNANSLGLRISKKTLPYEIYKEIHALFGSDTLRAIAEEFFGTTYFEFNEHLYAQMTGKTKTPASGSLHWDKQLTLKSWLYISPATKEYGPMRASPNSNIYLRHLREDHMHYGTPYNLINNLLDENAFPTISTGGPAGTFFLFITDTAHGATEVMKNYQRKIIRSQSRPLYIKHWANYASKL